MFPSYTYGIFLKPLYLVPYLHQFWRTLPSLYFLIPYTLTIVARRGVKLILPLHYTSGTASRLEGQVDSEALAMWGGELERSFGGPHGCQHANH